MPVRIPDPYVYLDWAATAPLCEEAATAMEPYQVPGAVNLLVGANANSLHAPGRAAFEALELARRSIAQDLRASRPNEIVFTSGATEADNAALIGLAEASVAARNQREGGTFVPHVIVSSIEHDAVLMPARRLQARGWRVTYLDPDAGGFIHPEALARALDADTVLVSIQMANGEMGAVNHIAKLAALAHEAGALFHTDAVQALGKVPVDLVALGVDAASFSAHKVCGPKGIGALYLRARTPFRAFLEGGGQEDGRRSGTQNVAAVVGFAAACHAAVSLQEAESARERVLRDGLYAALGALEGIDATVDVPAGSTDYLPNIVHVLARGLESETLVLRLDMKGFGVSGGSACSSHSLEPSHVLRSLGIDSDRAYGALRVSFGRYTSQADLDAFAAALASCLSWS